mgnify:CR=1 FL=1
MPQQQTNERIKERTRYNFPKLYKVIIFNDEITTMDFVVMILRKVFHKDEGEAERLMLDVHNNGQAVVGVYSYDMARTKVGQVTMMARISMPEWHIPYPKPPVSAIRASMTGKNSTLNLTGRIS